MAEQALTPALVTAIEENLTNTYIAMSAISFMIYDILLNLEKEIQYVWRPRWTVSTVLFMFARYYALVYNIIIFIGSITYSPSLKFCKSYYLLELVGGDTPLITVVNIILTMRLYAVYRSRKVLALFIGMIVCELALEIYVVLTLGSQTLAAVYAPPPGFPLPGCPVSQEPNERIALISWIPSMIIATVFFIMTIVKVTSEGYKLTPRSFLEIRRISPLISQIVRDGALIYFIMFVFLLVDIIIMEVSQGMKINMLAPWLIVVYSFSASRLLINLREAASRVDGVSTMGFQTTLYPAFAMNTMGETTTTETECLP